MFTYEQFKRKLEDDVEGYLTNQENHVNFLTTANTNQIIDAMSLIPNANLGTSVIVPTVSVVDMYNEFLNGADFETVLSNNISMLETMGAGYNQNEVVLSTIHNKDSLENVIMCLINTASNKELLKNSLHREFNDLSIIYKLLVSVNNEPAWSTIITQDIADCWNVIEADLYKVALENNKRLLPPIIRNIDDEIAGTFINNKKDYEPQPGGTMYIVSNEKVFYGAVSMLDEQVLTKVSQLLEDDIYILPSSINEVIAISKNSMDIDECANIVRGINEESVSDEERLSNNIYSFDKLSKRVTQLTNDSTPVIQLSKSR